MNAHALRKLGPHYIIVMMLVTRVIGSIGGALTIYYVHLTLRLSPQASHDFYLLAGWTVVMAVITTSLAAMWETRSLRAVLAELKKGHSIELHRGLDAGREAVRFCAVHHWHESFLVPLVTTGPVCIYMAWRHEIDAEGLMHICIATFLGISTSLLLSFFAIERWMRPVTRHLLDRGLPIAYSQLPESRLQVRMMICFGLIIAGTALMIGALAHQRALEILRSPHDPIAQAATVADLQRHIIYIFAVAVMIGFGLSMVLARSITTRVAELVNAMQRVEQGQLSERLNPTGTDEVDVLARQFNVMIKQLDQNDQTIRDLNTGLEQKVSRRTRQLSRSRRSLKRSLDKLTEADRLKTEFFSNVSHELRTPLTMILAPVDRLLERKASSLPADAANMLEMVRINGYRLLDLINRLLDFSKLEAGQMKLHVERVDLNALINKLASAATPLTQQRGIHLEIDCDPALAEFGADEQKVDTIVSNLLSNAIKFTPQGGRVRVETHAAETHVLVSIEDTGIGIDESQRERIFERFVQVDGSSSREFSGTGLGLSLVKGLVELHGGTIRVDSELGKGSKFTFDLPLRSLAEVVSRSEAPARAKMIKHFADLETFVERPKTTTQANSPATADALNPFAPTVLVVDDTPEMRTLLGEILSENYRVVYGCDGQEGLAAADASTRT